MTRTLTELSIREREYVISTVQREAEASGWSQLSNSRKSTLYSAWESQFNLTHATLKDGIMKGFDAAQGIPKKAEAEIQEEVACNHWKLNTAICGTALPNRKQV